MKFHRIHTAVLAGAMMMPVAGIGVAQAQQSSTEQRPSSQRQTQPGQTDQTTRQSRDRSSQQSQQSQQSQRSQQSQQQIEQILAADIKLANEAEIQLSELGQEQAQNQQVQQYAQKMAQAHEQMNQRLVQAVPQARQASLSDTQQPQAQQGQAGLQRQAEQEIYGMAAGADDQVQTLNQIHQQVYENALEMQREMLQDKQGAEFDQAFLGCQLAAHQAMLAKLQAYKEHVPQESQQLFQQAEQETRQHMQQATDLMQLVSDNS